MQKHREANEILRITKQILHNNKEMFSKTNVNQLKLPNISPIKKSNGNSYQLKVLSPNINKRVRKTSESMTNTRNPFRRHNLSDESRWLIRRLK